MPKSILRVSSPDGYKRPRQFINPETGEPLSPGLPPASPTSGGKSSPPGSPPMSPVSRPMSPGTTVRFAKATIHRVEVGPGRRFLPVKRKSKSTLTYISPLDPGTQKSAPKTMLQSPTKMRRHQENQAAMGRYWLRTEEEEAQWRAEAERRAEEEAERYRNEPASPPPGSTTPKSPVDVVEEQQALADKIAEIDKLPRQGLKPNPDKLEEEEAGASDSDTDEEAGADCDRETATRKVTAQNGAEANSKAPELVEDKTDDESEEEENGSEEAKPASLATSTSQKPEARNAIDTPSKETEPTESRSSERMAEKKTTEEDAERQTATTLAVDNRTEPTNSKTESSSVPSSSGSRPGGTGKRPGSPIQLVNSRTRARSRSVSPTFPTLPTSPYSKKSQAEKEKDRAKDKPRPPTPTSTTNPKPPSTRSASGGSSYHLHLSGRRGRRCFEEHKHEITA